MARKALAPPRNYRDDLTPNVRGRQTRHRMVCEWNFVLDMLTGKAPRRDAQGRTVIEVWADLVLANPPLEFARVAREMLPQELPESANDNAVRTSIQNLYLTAVQAANKMPDPRIIEATTAEEERGENGMHPPATGW
jgi:hypothetical protein